MLTVAAGSTCGGDFDAPLIALQSTDLELPRHKRSPAALIAASKSVEADKGSRCHG